MGCYGYICRKCGTQIVGDYNGNGEKAVLIHLRHGKEVGRAVGYYDEYGGVVGDDEFNSNEGSHINSHEEIHKSQFCLEDSFYENPKSSDGIYSGVVAFHKKCYDEATDECKNIKTPSKSDPNQSWGEVRDEFR